MYNIDDFYPIVNVPIRLYYDSDRAAARNTTGGGWVSEVGNYRVINTAWATPSGEVVQGTKPANGIALYAINNLGDGYAIGWVRDDDNIQAITMTNIPASISTSDADYKVTMRGMQGIEYYYRARIGTTTIHEATGTLTYPNTIYTFGLNATRRNLIYAALGNNLNGTMNISVTTYWDGVEIGTNSSSIAVSIPASNKPSIATNPKVNIIDGVGGVAYQGVSKISVAVAPSNVTLYDGSSLKSISVQIDAQTSPNYVTAVTFTSNIINKSGSIPIKVTYTDSRNRSTTFSGSVTFAAYSPVSIDQFTASRTETGYTINFSGRYPIQFGTGLSFALHRRARGATNWISVTSSTAFTGGGDGYYSHSKTNVFSDQSAQELRLSVADGAGVVAHGFALLGTEDVPISLGRKGAGIGTILENSIDANLQVGTEGIFSLGRILTEGLLKGETLEVGNAKIEKSGTAERTLQMTDSDITYNGQSLMDAGGPTFDNPITSVISNANYGAFTIANSLLIKFGKATVSGAEYTVTFNANGGSFNGAPVVIPTTKTTRWVLLSPSLTTVTETSFTASSITVDTGLGYTESHEVHYIAIGRKE